MFKRAVSHYFMENRIPPRRKTGTMHVVDAQRIKNLIVDYPLWVQLAKFKKIDFKYKLVYEDLPTNPNDLTKFSSNQAIKVIKAIAKITPGIA